MPSLNTLRLSAFVTTFLMLAGTVSAAAQHGQAGGSASSTTQPAVTQTSPVTAPSSQPAASTAASLRGMVTDPEQAVIPGATITLTPAKGKPIIATSGSDGSYHVTNVPSGSYAVTITMPGFASVVRQGVKFVNGQTLTMNVKLAIEEQSTEVNVTTSANQVSVDADSNASAVVIKGKDLDALSDDPDELSNELAALAGPAAGPNGGQIYVDGFTGGQLPPKSSIREIRVNQNPFSAQYDKPGFGRVEILTKPGSDAFHGQAMIQGNQAGLNTVSPFLQSKDSLGNPIPLPSYYTVFAMGSLSGPLTHSSSFTVNGSYRDIEDQAIIAGRIVSASPDDLTLCQPGTTGSSGCADYAYPGIGRAVSHPQKRSDIAPRVDLALSESNTLTIRYQHEQGSTVNGSVGQYSLPSYGYNSDSHEDTIQISDSQVFGAKMVNETRFEYERDRSKQKALSNLPSLVVSQAFNGGGNPSGSSSTHQDHFEVQNYTSIALAKNFIRLGGRFRSDREAQWSNAGSNGTYTYNTTADYIAGTARQFTINTIMNPSVNLSLADVGLYAEDDWKLRSNLTLSYGLRYEAQGIINSSHDLAPRISVAYGIPRKGGQPVTVIRGGFGIFYDRYDIGNVITTRLQNGVNQSEIIKRPNAGSICTPDSPAGCDGTTTPTLNTIYTLAPNLRSEYNLQAAIGVDQQLSKTASLSVNYISANGNHAYFATVQAPTSTSYQYQYQSEGIYRQQQIIANLRWNPSRRYSLFGYYTYSHANGNTNGATTFLTDTVNPRTDYGRSAFNQTHRLFLFGNASLPYDFSLSPFIVANTGRPYNITTGSDVNGDSQFNDRAAFAPGVTAANANCYNANDFTDPSQQGSVITNNYARTPAGFCTAPLNFTFNLRVAKSFGFGKRHDAGADAASSGSNNRGSGRGSHGGGGGSRGGGGPMGMMGGGGSSSHRYNFNLGAQAFNLFNFVPYGTPNGGINNPAQFGKSVALVSNGPGSSSSAVRRIFLQLAFNF